MGPKSSKHNELNGESLDRKTIEELCESTGFTEAELLEWHRNFYKDCPDGKLTLKQFEQEYAKVMGKPTAKTADYIKHMFSVYDEDRNQFIDFKEFVMALSAASAVNRLRLIDTLFHVFDLDNDGKITKEEIGKMLHTLVDVTSSQNKHQNSDQRDRSKQMSLQQRVDEAFNELNANDDDHITKDEFIDWYMKSGLLSDVQSEEINANGPADIHKIGKRSRKQIKRSVRNKMNNEHVDNHNAQTRRYMSRMTERRMSSQYDDENNDNSDNSIDDRPSVTFATQDSTHDHTIISKPKTVTRLTSMNSNNIEPHRSKENEKWQHLFNSVLGQVRAQRTREQQQTTVNNSQNFQAWRHEGVQILKDEYSKQNSTDVRDVSSVTRKVNLQPSMRTSERRSPSPDVLTVRL